MLIKKSKKNLNILILAIILCTIVFGALLFGKIKSNDIENYQHYDKYSKGFSKSIKEILLNEKHTPLSDRSHERLASLYNLMGLAYFNKTKLFFKEENYKKAEAAFGYSLDSLKNCKFCNNYDLFESIVYNNLAWTYYDYAHFTKSAKLKPKLYKHAIENFNNVLNKHINNKIENYPFEKIQCYLFISDSYKNLGIIYAQEGKVTEAIRNFEAAKQKLQEVCKIINSKTSKEDIIASSQVWCDTKSVVHYLGFSEINYEEYNNLQNTIKHLSKSIMEDVNDQLSMLIGKNSSSVSSSNGCTIKQKVRKRVNK